MRIRNLVLGGVGLRVVATTVVALGLTLGMRSPERTRGPDTVRVGRRNPGRGVRATGGSNPVIGAEVRVGSRVSGVVKRLFVRIGDKVEKGQLLAELDDRELIARRDQAAATVAVSRANVEYARADLERKRALHASRLIA